MAIGAKKMQVWLGVEHPDDGEEQKPVEEQTESPAEEQAEGSLEEEFPTLFGLLEENGAAVEDAIAELDGEALSDPEFDYSSDEKLLGDLAEALDVLPTDIKDAMVQELKDLTFEKATEIADALAAGDHVVDAERMAGFLFHGSAVLHAMSSPDDAEEEPAEDDEEPAEDEEISTEE